MSKEKDKDISKGIASLEVFVLFVACSVVLSLIFGVLESTIEYKAEEQIWTPNYLSRAADGELE